MHRCRSLGRIDTEPIVEIKNTSRLAGSAAPPHASARDTTEPRTPCPATAPRLRAASVRTSAARSLNCGHHGGLRRRPRRRALANVESLKCQSHFACSDPDSENSMQTLAFPTLILTTGCSDPNGEVAIALSSPDREGGVTLPYLAPAASTCAITEPEGEKTELSIKTDPDGCDLFLSSAPPSTT